MLTLLASFYTDSSTSNYQKKFSSGKCDSWNLNLMHCSFLEYWWSSLHFLKMNLGIRNRTLTIRWIISMEGLTQHLLIELCWVLVSFIVTFLVDDHLSGFSWFLVLVLADSWLSNLESSMISILWFKDFYVFIFINFSLCSQTIELCCLYTNVLRNSMYHSRSWVNWYFLACFPTLLVFLL